MKLDNDLVRTILLAVEEHDQVDTQAPPPELAQSDPQIVAQHIKLLKDHGSVNAIVLDSHDGPDAAVAFELTWREPEKT